jgi:NTE family protein
MKRQMINVFVALSLAISSAPGAFAQGQGIQEPTEIKGPTDAIAVPKQQLPSQEPKVPADAERGPKVIENPAPTKIDRVGATEIHDANPATDESVDDSRQPKLISVPRGSDRTRYQVRRTQERKTMAIALGGGGARGAAHIGVLRVLEQENIPIDYIVGNSMGAIIGGSYAAGVPLDRLQELGLSGKMRKAYLPGVLTRVLTMPFSHLLTMFRDDYAGLWSGKRFQKYLESYLGKDTCIEQTKIPFSAVATNLKDGEAYRLSEGNLATAIRASSTLTPLLKPVKIGERVYVDGGIRANLPASAAKDTGADVIVAVLVDEPLRELPDETFYKYKGIANRLADIILAVTDEHQLQFADVIINPDVSGIPILSEERADYSKAIQAGEEAARKALPALRKRMGLPENAQLVGQPIQME